MRFIGKKSVCAAALGVLPAFYFVRKRETQVWRANDGNVNAIYQSPYAPNPSDR